MLLRFFSFLVLIVFITSCDKLSFSKKNNKQAIDTVVDYSSVDKYPSFKLCDSIIDKEKKADCFRTTIHQKIGEKLLDYKLTAKDSINEVVIVNLRINAKGEFQLEAVEWSENIKNQIPKLDSLLRETILNLPNVVPANKRGIPVATQYRLPIQISLKE